MNKNAHKPNFISTLRLSLIPAFSCTLFMGAVAIAQDAVVAPMQPPQVNVDELTDQAILEQQQEDLGITIPSNDVLVNEQPENYNTLETLPELPNPVESKDQIDEDLFFDAESLVPQGEMGRKSGPTKVNPRLQPASRLVIVREASSAGSKAANLTAAERAMALGRFESALDIYNRLQVTNRRDPNIQMGRAIALQHLGRNDEAINAYSDLLEKHPNHVEAQINMLGLMAAQYPAVAAQRLLALSEKHPDNVGIIAQLAFINAKIRNYPDALRFFGQAASLEPQNANHIYNMAVIADKAGRKGDAIRYYEQALEVDTLYGAGETIPRQQVFERLARIR